MIFDGSVLAAFKKELAKYLKSDNSFLKNTVSLKRITGSGSNLVSL